MMRTLGSEVTRFSGAGRGLFQFGPPDVVAGLVRADQLPAVPFGDLLGEEFPAALGAGFEHGLVPEREVTLRIVHAAVEHFATAGLSFRLLPAIFRTDDAGELLLDVLAL